MGNKIRSIISNPPLKILFAGDAETEKSNFIRKLDSNQPNQICIGIDYVKWSLDIGGKSIKVQLWDCPTSLETFELNIERYVHNGYGAVIVYDITNYETYVDAQTWLQLLRHENERLEILLVGNRNDRPELRQVSLEEAVSFSERNRLSFIETSTEKNMIAFVVAFQSFVREEDDKREKMKKVEKRSVLQRSSKKHSMVGAKIPL